MQVETPRVLFVSHYHEPVRSTVLPLCKLLESCGHFSPHVFAEHDFDGRIETMCRGAGVPYRVARRGAKAPETDTPRRQAQRTSRRIGPVGWVLRTVGNVATIVRKLFVLTAILREIRPAVLILLDDRTLLACRWIRAAELLNIPVLVIQWAAIHRWETIVSLRDANQRGVDQSSPLVRRLEDFVARMVPNAVRSREGRSVCYLPADQVLAHWLTGAFPRHSPWTFGGGNAPLVAAMGDAWRKRMIDGGVPPEKIVTTGHPDQDAWFRISQRWTPQDTANVRRELQVGEDQKLITVIAPALSLRSHGCRAGEITLDDLRAQLRTVVDVIARLGDSYVAILKVHPRDTLEEFNGLQQAKGAATRIVRDVETNRLIAASCLVTCQWSTTVMIAQALAVPVLLFDFRGSPSAEVWQGVPGLPCATELGDYEKRLRSILADSATHGQTELQRREFVNQFLCCDGQATSRLANLIGRQAGIPTRSIVARAA